MEGENQTPEAAATSTEANSTSNTQTNTQTNAQTSTETSTQENSKTATSDQDSITPEQVAAFFGASVDKINDFKKFADSNGKFDKAFDKMKSAISNPEPKQPEQPQRQVETTQTQPTQEPTRPQSGHMTRDEFFAKQYFDSLAADPKYANVADKIRNGEALKEMASYGISAINGNDINDAQVRRFLDMYSKANAPAQAAAPVTNIPTVEYVDVKEINSMKDVDEIMRQNINLKAQGKPLHPQTEAAKKFATDFYKKK